MFKHVISVSGGKDSTAVLILAIMRFGRKNVVPIFCDTGNEHEAVYAYLNYLEQALGVTIQRLKADFSDRFPVKRMFIARDQRTKREYSRTPKLDAQGNVIFRRTNSGEIELRMVWKNGVMDLEGVPKMCKSGGRRVRWTNKAKRRALAALHPSGNPFLDLCMLKGRFPSRKAQFCTEELKRNMAVDYQLSLVESGHTVISWQGVRRDESANRRHAKKLERADRWLWMFRPVVDWSAADVLGLAQQHGIAPNPLYLQGMGRVGCMPCINVNKAELRQIAARWPGHIERVADWELKVGACSKRGYSTFMTDAHSASDRREIFADLNVWSRVEWSKTTRGGRQFNLLDEIENDPLAGCSSAYGLCDQGGLA